MKCVVQEGSDILDFFNDTGDDIQPDQFVHLGSGHIGVAISRIDADTWGAIKRSDAVLLLPKEAVEFSRGDSVAIHSVGKSLTSVNSARTTVKNAFVNEDTSAFDAFVKLVLT